jgi:hypothetical protein
LSTSSRFVSLNKPVKTLKDLLESATAKMLLSVVEFLDSEADSGIGLVSAWG